jgi:aspartate/methionine/tyrosine aminotransferase
MPRISRKAEGFTESVIREMSRLAVAANAVNLGQGFPDFACPAELKQAAADAVNADLNQYAVTWGAKPLRDAIAAKTKRFYPGWTVDPETELTVTCGATEGMIAAMLAILDPGDEIVVFEPYCGRWTSRQRPDQSAARDVHTGGTTNVPQALRGSGMGTATAVPRSRPAP